MKTYIYPLFLFLLCIGCTSQKNSEDFINATEGRYLFNDNEVIEIYFKDQILHAKWRGNDDIELLKVNDSAFYMKELNEKMIFVSLPEMHIELAPKKEHDGIIYHFKKLSKNEKTPNEYFEADAYDKALEAFLKIKQQDSLSPVISERRINSMGYRFLREKKAEKAIEIFKINMALHPKSSNVYDSTADAYLILGDTIKAREYYKKALAINPENRHAKRAYTKLIEKK
ncbi:tetratricopeptide repeat protein [Polaribacter batillariae]|uniref:Tetratricopeptide repeat protein n=1 Tax=Polaribacter batillariae TaxID=2808900 RepID=A0ABX7SXQ2_9FLAO|nr:tetratricopeptide repeat protein [Polaribacter batillariae]QTD38258.1 tetratricopeptide repeat protein [Polaribacter batillariae]